MRAAVLTTALAAVLATGAAPPAPTGRVLFHLQDPRIDEASGIALGIASPGIDYVENDSGDVNRFFALDGRTGDTAAVVTVTGATNVDWEDIATGRDAAGTPSVWLADIGDNAGDRSEIDVYRVPEPTIGVQDRDRAISTPPAARWRLRYPGGPVNAESLAVAPDGTGYVVTKTPTGRSGVYRLPAHPDAARVQTLTRVGSVDLRPGSGIGQPGLLATAAGISPNGRLFAVRTYTDVFVWRLPRTPGDPVAAALRTRPTRLELPLQPQGEGMAVRDDRLVLDSEGVGTAVWSVPLPAALRATSTPSSGAGPTPSARTSAPPAAGRHRGDPARTVVLGALAAVVLAGAGLIVGLRRAGRRRRGRRAG